MPRPREGYRWLNHTADVGVIVRGATIESLFEVAAEALTDLITDRAAVRERVPAAFQIAAPDLDQILVRWLTELLARFDVDGAVFHRFVVHSVADGNLDAEAFGETFDPNRHPFRAPVKGVTHHRLSVRRTRDGWEATIIFDL